MMMAKVIHDDDDDSDDTSLPGRPFLFFNRRKSFGIPAAGGQTLAKATLHYDDDIIRGSKTEKCSFKSISKYSEEVKSFYSVFNIGLICTRKDFSSVF